MTIVPGRRLRDAGDQTPDGRVGVGDLAVVAIDVAAAERVAVVGLVRLVRLEEVDPHERALRVGVGVIRQHLIDPLLRVDELELHVFEVEVRIRVALQLVPVDEEHRRRVERGRAPAELAQHGGDRIVMLPGRHPGHRREILRGQHRRDRKRRVRRLRVRAREAHAVRGQRVDGRRGRARVAVGADVVGAKRVDGDQQDVGLRPARPVGQRRQRDVGGAAFGHGDRRRAQRHRDGVQRQRRHRRPLVRRVAHHLAGAQLDDRPHARHTRHRHRQRQPRRALRPLHAQARGDHEQRQRQDGQRRVEPAVEPRQHPAVRGLRADRRDDQRRDRQAPPAPARGRLRRELVQPRRERDGRRPGDGQRDGDEPVAGHLRGLRAGEQRERVVRDERRRGHRPGQRGPAARVARPAHQRLAGGDDRPADAARDREQAGRDQRQAQRLAHRHAADATSDGDARVDDARDDATDETGADPGEVHPASPPYSVRDRSRAAAAAAACAGAVSPGSADHSASASARASAVSSAISVRLSAASAASPAWRVP